MANYCILRTTKLKTDGNVAASLAHGFRARETPNADPDRTPLNISIGAKTVAEAMARYRAKLPVKIRSNGVRAIEYLISYSGGALATEKDREAYFKDALAWLKKRHGSGLFYAGIHVDETVPHLYAYAIPFDNKNNLNARFFLGGREKLSAMQTEFWETVGRKHNLERGIQGSRAKHTTLKQYYGRITATERAIDPPTRKFGESRKKYQERYKTQIRPLVVAATGAQELIKRKENLEKGLRMVNLATTLTDGLTTEQQQQLKQISEAWKKENRKNWVKTRQQTREKGIERD